MLNFKYELTADKDLVDVSIVDGKVVLAFEWTEEDGEELWLAETAETNGEHQSDCLWEKFEHNFQTFDASGNLITWDEKGQRIK